MTRALYAVINSFVLSNMSPQFCQFNRGVWQNLEAMIRLWVAERKTLYVITGTVFDWDTNDAPDAASDIRRMKSNNAKARVAIPSHMYKIIVSEADNGAFEVLPIMLPNDRTDLNGNKARQYLADHITTIDAIEAVAGMQFFTHVEMMTPEALAAMKSMKPEALWPVKGVPNPSLVNATCRATAALPF